MKVIIFSPAVISIIVIQFISFINSANILFYFGIAGHSHVNSLWPVMERMANDGHNVTLLTTFVPKSKHPKVNIFYAEDMYKTFAHIWDEGSDMIQSRMDNQHEFIWDVAIETALVACKVLLQSPNSQDLIHNSKFDLVIADSAFNECGTALAVYKYKCPFIIYSAVTVMTKNFDEFGLPVESSSIPDMQMGYKTPMTFYEKLQSTLAPLRWHSRIKFEYNPALSEIIYNGLGLSEYPEVAEIHSKTSLVLQNAHFSHEYARSLPPLYVPIAGIQIKEKRTPIPKDIETFISKPGTDGFIYVSFGTVVRISKSRPELRQKLFRAFGNFSNIQFVWKWEENIPEEGTYPSNIQLASWLPQQDLYAHKRIRGIIGHGGANGVIESVHFGVPSIIFPFIGDQDYNANCLAGKGLAIPMEISDFTEAELQANIEKLLTDRDWHARVKEASNVFKDRPMKPVDTAAWWIEFVLRYKDTSKYLMPLAVKQTWYERRLLDIWFLLFATMTLAVVIISFVVYKALSLFIWNNSNEKLKNMSNGTKSKMH